MRSCLAIGVLSAVGCAPSRPCGVDLWYTGDGSAESVVVVGDWNGWDPTADPMEPVHRGAWMAHVEPDPGDHTYMFQVDGRPVRDLHAPLIDYDSEGGIERSVVRVEDCTVPTLLVDDIRATGQGLVDGTLLFLRGDGGPRLDPDRVTARTLTGHRLGTVSVPARGDIVLHGDDLPPDEVFRTVVLGDLSAGFAFAELLAKIDPELDRWPPGFGKGLCPGHGADADVDFEEVVETDFSHVRPFAAALWKGEAVVCLGCKRL